MNRDAYIYTDALVAYDYLPSGVVENRTEGFVKTAEEILWIFIFGAFVGFIVETAYCLIIEGCFQWRGSMVLFPLNAVYGFGALMFYFITPKGNTASLFRIFISGAVAGTVVEFVCSWMQQTMFGSISWDYSQMPLNIGGRICLLFTVFWGLLAILWAKGVQPFVEKAITRVPRRILKPLTAATIIILVVFVIISALAVARWGARIEGLPRSGFIDLWLDVMLPNSTMEEVYANMKFLR